MGKIIENMNYNLNVSKHSSKSDLPQITLEIIKTSLKNGTFSRMSSVFDEQLLSSKCFNDSEKYKEMDNVINFFRAVKSELQKQSSDFMEIENEPAKTM